MIVMVMTNSVKNILRTLLDSKREDIHKVFKLEGKLTAVKILGVWHTSRNDLRNYMDSLK